MTILPIHELLHSGRATAYYTTRATSSPEEPYSGFNVCHYTGDDPAHVVQCRRALAAHFSLPDERVIIPRQTHSSDVAVITALPVGASDIEGVDAVVTDMSDIIIGVNTADCVPVVLIDPTAGISGVAHAGWRGAVGGVVEATVRAMMRLGAHPYDIKAAMGPSICCDCFEVGPEVAERFDSDCVTIRPGEKPHVSLHKYIDKTLISCGLQSGNIKSFDNSMCTRCNPDTFWSARKSGVNSGRIYTFIVTK